MATETLRDMLLWCSIINFGLLILWSLFFALFRDWAFNIHNKLFKISADKFNTINYASMAFYKICVFVFNIVPYIALRIIE